MKLLTVANQQASICRSISVPGGDCDRLMFSLTTMMSWTGCLVSAIIFVIKIRL
jgi:hypothetical protein